MKRPLKFILPVVAGAAVGVASYVVTRPFPQREQRQATPNNLARQDTEPIRRYSLEGRRQVLYPEPKSDLEETLEAETTPVPNAEPRWPTNLEIYLTGINPTREDFVEEYSSKFRKLENRRLGEIIPEGDYFRNSYPEAARTLASFSDYSGRTFGEVFEIPPDDEIAQLWDPEMEREYRESLSVRGIPEWATEVDCGTGFTGVEDYVNLVSPPGPHGRPRFLREHLANLAKFNSVMLNPNATGLEIAEADHLREEAKGWFSFRARKMMGEYLRKKDGEIYALADYLLEVNSE